MPILYPASNRFKYARSASDFRARRYAIQNPPPEYPSLLFSAMEQGVWYDPSDLSTLFQDSAGATPVTAVGQPVGRILDKSGRGNHAAQATAAARPVLQQDANGKYYLAFDGVDDSLATAAINFTATDKMTSIFGALHANTSVAFIYSGGNTDSLGTSSTEVTVRDVVSTDVTGRTGNSAKSHRRFTALYNAPYVAAIQFDISQPTTASEQVGRINGSASTGSDVITANDTGNFASAPLVLGARGGGNFPLNGRIYSLIVRGALSDAAQIAAAEAYVNSKTGAY